RYARAFGFGASTGIELQGEKFGLVPRPARRTWPLGETVNLSIGQGAVLVTPTQVARFMAAVANGGVLWRPRIVQRIERPESGVLYRRADRAEDPERDLLREGRGDRGSRLMLHVDRRLFQNVDWVLLTAACALVLMSVMTLATLSVGRAAGVIAVRQAAWFGVGLLALLTVASLDYRRLVRAAPALYLLGLVGLALVYAFGRAVSGARRWIVLGPLSVQPSELFKVAFVLMTVWVITSRWAQPAGRATLAMTLPIAAVPFVLIIKQPDLGTALLLFPVLMVLLIGAGLRLRLLGGALAA